MTPEPGRVAVHLAGHAVVQTLVGGQRFAVARVSLDGEHGDVWQGASGRGEASLDRDTFLGLYEFGLVTLAGIAAEGRYLEGKVDAEPVVALSDLARWQEAALDVLRDGARVDFVSVNIMRTLEQWLANDRAWRVVECLAAELLAQGAVEGEPLRRILEPLTTGEAGTCERKG